MSKTKGKGKGKVTLAPADGAAEDGYRTLKALVLRREGYGYEEIADRLDCSPWEARTLTSIAYARLSTEAADEIRSQVEDRLDDVLRRLYQDLNLAGSQTQRNALYALIMKNEAQRSSLLGLSIPPGTPDAPAPMGGIYA